MFYLMVILLILGASAIGHAGFNYVYKRPMTIIESAIFGVVLGLVMGSM